MTATDTLRCFGTGDALYEHYHDHEWGHPVHGEAALFERLTLEGAQSGLSWLTVLRKREGYREAFAGFDAAVVARWGEAEVERLMNNPGIVRNRRKIESTLSNARALVALWDAGETLDEIVWSYQPLDATPADAGTADAGTADAGPRTWVDIPALTPESTALARDLKRRGFTWLGPTTVYAAMQACGLVNDHLVTCPARALTPRG